MNGNPYNINFIGATNIYPLQEYIDTGDSNLSNLIKSTSNILSLNSSNYTDALDYKVSRLIREETEHITFPLPADITNTYVYTSNVGSEIRFWCKSTPDYPIIVPAPDVPDYRVKINPAGKLCCYYTYDPAISLTVPNGWIDIVNSIVGLIASDANTGIVIGGLQIEISKNFQTLELEIQLLVSTLYAHNILDDEVNQSILNGLENMTEIFDLDATTQVQTFYNATRGFLTTGRLAYLSQISTILLTKINQNPITSCFLGIGGVAFGAFVGISQNLFYTNTYLQQVRNAIEKNSNLSTAKKTEINQIIFEEKVNGYIDYCSNFSNLVLFQGYINSNVVSQQYIPSLKTDSLYLNGGNINGVSSINSTTGSFASISTTKLANRSIPNVGYFGGISDRVILYNGDNSNYPYSIGVNVNSLWNSVPSGCSFDWYVNGGIYMSLSSSELNITGNLTTTGTINGTTINANNFVENGNNLSTIYATNTNLNTTINNINNTLNLVYTQERQYPPKLYDSATPDTSNYVINNSLCYSNSLVINSYINGYGIGNYTIYSSSTYTPETSKYLLFNYNTIETALTPHFAPNEYNGATGVYQKANYIKSDYLGDWIIIKLPNPIVLTKFRFHNRNTLTRRAPGIWKMYGSNDGINFVEIPQGHNIISRLIITDYTGLGLGYYEKVLASSFSTPYLYYGWTINQIVGTDNILNFSELSIFGKEVLNPIYNYISSNVLSNNLLNYLPLTGGTINGNVNATNFIQNGNFLDTIYTTNTNLNSIINSINNDITALYTIERQYPPKLYDTTTTETATVFNGINCFTTSFNINTYINGYAIGEYITYSSTSYSSSAGKNLLFNYNLTDGSGGHWQTNQYNSSGIYIGNNYIKNDYLGDWVIIKMPYKFILTRYKFYVRSPYTIRAPAEWKFYGSNDGITFTEIIEASNLTRLTASSYSIGYYEQIISNTFTTPYLYFAITVNKLVGNDTVLNFNEFQIFGKELINNLINYTTSNVCQNLIIGNENIQKKYSFNFTCSTPITISSTIYYKYDIDLRNYTKTKPSGNPLSPYRIFNIRIFLSSVYFEVMVNNTYNILNYEIYMSNEINAGSYGGQIGINIVANHIGNTPANPLLVNILPSYFTLLRTADFNYLSVISTIQNANLNCIIQDILY